MDKQVDFSKPIAPFKPDPDWTAAAGQSSVPPITPPATPAAPVADTGLTVNLQRPTLAQAKTQPTSENASIIQSPTDLSTGQPATQPPRAGARTIEPPPLGARAARAVTSGLTTGMEAVGAVNELVQAPVKTALGAAGKFVGDFAKELYPSLSESAAPPATVPAITAPSVARTAPPVTTAPRPAILGGNGIMDKPLTRPTTPSFTTPALMVPPTLQPSGELPTLKAGANQNIFDAMLQLGNDISAYRGNAAINARAMANFSNLMKASNYNLEALSTMTKVQTEFGAEERKNFDQEFKSRTAEAVRQLALGPKSAKNPNGYDPAQEAGLRILSGAGKNNGHPIVIFGPPDLEGRQQKMAAWAHDNGPGAQPTIIPIQFPRAQTMTAAHAKEMQSGNKWTDAQMQQYLKQNGLTVENR